MTEIIGRQTRNLQFPAHRRIAAPSAAAGRSARVRLYIATGDNNGNHRLKINKLARYLMGQTVHKSIQIVYTCTVANKKI